MGLLYIFFSKLIVVKDREEIRKVKAQRSAEFEMKDLGNAKKNPWHEDGERQEGRLVVCKSKGVH